MTARLSYLFFGGQSDFADSRADGGLPFPFGTLHPHLPCRTQRGTGHLQERRHLLDDNLPVVPAGAPNAARLFSAPSIWGPWKQHPNPCQGEGSERTFGGQSTYILQLPGNRYLFMADIWRPKSLMYSGYLWIPVRFDEEGMPYLTLSGKCNPSDGR